MECGAQLEKNSRSGDSVSPSSVNGADEKTASSQAGSSVLGAGEDWRRRRLENELRETKKLAAHLREKNEHYRKHRQTAALVRGLGTKALSRFLTEKRAGVIAAYEQERRYWQDEIDKLKTAAQDMGCFATTANRHG